MNKDAPFQPIPGVEYCKIMMRSFKKKQKYKRRERSCTPSYFSRTEILC